jgi:hypothetical protein
MLALESVEERLRAIEWEIHQIRSTGTPGYMRMQSLERIEAQIQAVRQGLDGPLADLAVVYRLTDLLAGRLAEALLASSDLTRRVEDIAARAVVAAEEKRKISDTLRALARGEGNVTEAASLLPVVRAIDPYNPHSLHALRVSVEAYLSDRREADRAAAALLQWRQEVSSEEDGESVRGELGLERDGG